ncbi:hypothetical protein EJB05_06431, partial [Eragrostis curvula]
MAVTIMWSELSLINRFLEKSLRRMEDYEQLQQWRSGGADGLELPPGFRFHPSDEEIITFYLAHKMLDDNFTAIAIGETDINKSEPWELPYKAKMGEKEWYFYCLKDRKYPTGSRVNRATEAGYWKATGKDRGIYCGASSVPVLLGMKKTLVFYKGRAPNGVKTDWVMHEYRLDGKGRVPCPAVSSNPNTKKPCSSSKEEWVVCRVFQKSSCARKESDFTPVTAPSSRMPMDGGGEDLSCMNFPMPTQFPVEIEDFTDNSNGLYPLLDCPFESFYSTDDMGSSVLHPLLPMNTNTPAPSPSNLSSPALLLCSQCAEPFAVDNNLYAASVPNCQSGSETSSRGSETTSSR